MPTYQYENLKTGEIEEHYRAVQFRDCMPPHLKRLTVPQRVAYANNPALKEPGADVDVPRAFRDYELSGKSAKQIEKETGFSREHIRRVWDF